MTVRTHVLAAAAAMDRSRPRQQRNIIRSRLTRSTSKSRSPTPASPATATPSRAIPAIPAMPPRIGQPDHQFAAR